MDIANLITQSLKDKADLARELALINREPGMRQAAASTTVANAAANLDQVKAQLLPAESAATVAKTKADTGLVNETTKYYGQDILSEIALRAAQRSLYKSQAQNVDTDTEKARRDLKVRTISPDSLGSIMAAGRPTLQW